MKIFELMKMIDGEIPDALYKGKGGGGVQAPTIVTPAIAPPPAEEAMMELTDDETAETIKARTQGARSLSIPLKDK